MRGIERLGLVLLVLAAGCTPTAPPAMTARDVAALFERTCLAAAASGTALSRAFIGAEGFAPARRPRPGPRTTPYDGPGATGIVQRFPPFGPIEGRSCALLATVADPDAIHAAAGTPAPSGRAQASERRVVMPDGRVLRIVAARLGPRAAPGSVRLSAYLEDPA